MNRLRHGPSPHQIVEMRDVRPDVRIHTRVHVDAWEGAAPTTTLVEPRRSCR